MAHLIFRIKVICGIVIFLLVMLAGRLFYLQAVVGSDLAGRGLLGRVHELKAESMRGMIYDRNFRPLVNLNQRIIVTFFPSQCRDQEKVVDSLAAIGAGDKKTIQKMVFEAKHPIKIIDNITAAQQAAIEALQLDGVVISTVTERYSPLASHAIGYINPSDNQGISGLEASYDEVLKKGGQKYIAALLDGQAALIPGLSYRHIMLSETDQTPSLVLTIDRRVQEATEAVFDAYARKGAVVVMEPGSGEILAMVSRPNFNAQELPAYLAQKNSPLVNRAITAYQPGSVLKLAVAAAALEQKIVTPEQKFTDFGYIDIGGTVFHGWDKNAGKRDISFKDAIAYSSNPVLIDVGLRLGMGKIVDFLCDLGFGSKTILNLYGEEAGNLPDKENFYKGEVANLSIGQGVCEVTPVQVAQMIATIVSDGRFVPAKLVKKVIGDTAVINDDVALPKQAFSPETAAALREMMTAVTRYGTGQAAFVVPGGAAGKTGSAETGRLDSEGHGISHAWFAGYAPLTTPRYIVVVFVEEGMSGGDIAAPIFHDIMVRLGEIR